MKSNNQKNQNERGASLVEYVILVALITITCITAIRSFGEEVALTMGGATREIAGAGGGERPE